MIGHWSRGAVGTNTKGGLTRVTMESMYYDKYITVWGSVVHTALLGGHGRTPPCAPFTGRIQ